MLKKLLWIFLISMVPIIELRGAIPVGAYQDLPMYLNFLAAVVGNMLPVPFILLFIPAVLAFMKRHHILPRLVDWVERKGQRGVEKLQKREQERARKKEESAGGDAAPASDTPVSGDTAVADTSAVPAVPVSELSATAVPSTAPAKPRRARIPWGTCVGLLAFVAIPLPGTGAWTGALVASLFGMKKRYAFLTILLGVLIAGVVMTLASYGIFSALDFLVPKH